MAGNEVFKHAVRAMQNATEKVLTQAGVSVDDIALFAVPHQANTRIITATAERAGIPPEKVQVTLPRYGNNSAASIPIAISDAIAEGKLKPGDLVLTTSFGAGFTWAAALFRSFNRIRRKVPIILRHKVNLNIYLFSGSI